MSTTFYLRNLPSDLGGTGKLMLSLTRGATAGGVTTVTNTTASGTNIGVTQTAGGTALFWFTPPLYAVIISGTVTINGWGLESSLSANTTLGLEVDRVGPTGAFISTVKFDVGATEWGTSASARNVANTPTSTTLANGDRLQVTMFVSNFGTMGGGFTATNTYDGPTAAAAGDTFITLTETVTPITAYAPSIVSQAVRRAAHY